METKIASTRSATALLFLIAVLSAQAPLPNLMGVAEEVAHGHIAIQTASGRVVLLYSPETAFWFASGRIPRIP
jgi:hypothetical protein